MFWRKKQRGSFQENNIIPQLGQLVWFHLEYKGSQQKGNIIHITEIKRGHHAIYYVDIKTPRNKFYFITWDRLFNYKPKLKNKKIQYFKNIKKQIWE